MARLQQLVGAHPGFVFQYTQVKNFEKLRCTEDFCLLTGFGKTVSSSLCGRLSVIYKLSSINLTQYKMRVVWEQDLRQEITPLDWTRIVKFHQAFSANVGIKEKVDISC